jgi:hypothetical protein
MLLLQPRNVSGNHASASETDTVCDRDPNVVPPVVLLHGADVEAVEGEGQEDEGYSNSYKSSITAVGPQTI